MNQIVIITGWVKTGMIDKPIEEIGSRLHMKGRIILPEEIANAIWLMSFRKPAPSTAPRLWLTTVILPSKAWMVSRLNQRPRCKQRGL